MLEFIVETTTTTARIYADCVKDKNRRHINRHKSQFFVGEVIIVINSILNIRAKESKHLCSHSVNNDNDDWLCKDWI